MKAVILTSLLGLVLAAAAEEKRQMIHTNFDYVQKIQRCRLLSSLELCGGCCDAAAFTLPLEDSECRTVCQVTHAPVKRQVPMGHMLNDIAAVDHCRQELTTDACVSCCHSAGLAVALEETACDTMCHVTHLGR